jgi:hypothetical protein
MKIATYSIGTYCRISKKVEESLDHLDEITNYVYQRWDMPAKQNYLDRDEEATKPIEERTAGARMLKDAQDGVIDLIVMRTYERLSEETKDFFRAYAMFDRLCCPIFFIHDPADLNILGHITRHKKFHEEGLRGREMARGAGATA